MNRHLRAASLPAVALVLVSGVLAIQLAYGGGTYEPLQPADPCAARTVTSQSEGIEGLTERLVLIGVDDAACSLGVSREAFTLELAGPRHPHRRPRSTPCAQGLLSAVDEMEDDGSLPPASELVDEALDSADLNELPEDPDPRPSRLGDRLGAEDRRRPHPRDRGPGPAQPC